MPSNCGLPRAKSRGREFPDGRPTVRHEAVDRRQERKPDDGCARPFVVTLAAQDDLLGHSAEANGSEG